MPFRKIFLSRWAALLWAGGMVWTAVDAVGFGPSAHVGGNATVPEEAGDDKTVDATGVTVNADDLATLANAMKGE